MFLESSLCYVTFLCLTAFKFQVKESSSVMILRTKKQIERGKRRLQEIRVGLVRLDFLKKTREKTRKLWRRRRRGCNGIQITINYIKLEHKRPFVSRKVTFNWNKIEIKGCLSHIPRSKRFYYRFCLIRIFQDEKRGELFDRNGFYVFSSCSINWFLLLIWKTLHAKTSSCHNACLVIQDTKFQYS